MRPHTTHDLLVLGKLIQNGRSSLCTEGVSIFDSVIIDDHKTLTLKHHRNMLSGYGTSTWFYFFRRQTFGTIFGTGTTIDGRRTTIVGRFTLVRRVLTTFVSLATFSTHS